MFSVAILNLEVARNTTLCKFDKLNQNCESNRKYGAIQMIQW